MARRFVRVDLSNTARDFRPIAIEPGVPLLDPSNANARILFKWLGGLVAEPEWEAESVNFYVRDDHGGRLENVTCQPAGDIDLNGPLEGDLAALQQRIAKAKPETATERAVHKALRQSFTLLVEDEGRGDRDNYFFRYRDAGGRWRLVWCWGYQRVDQEPAPSVICSDPDCGLLFVRRADQSHKCPSCEASLLAQPARRIPWKRVILVGLLLFLLGGALVDWYLNRNRLLATPESWSGPAGSRVAFQVRTPGWFGWGGRDVSREAVAVTSDPRVARFDRFDCTGTAASPGTALVRFYLGHRSSSATLTVLRARMPKSVAIEPGEIELGVGTTAHVKLIGRFEDRTTADLTAAAEWTADRDGVVFAHEGFLEGLSEGVATIAARYRASRQDASLEASAGVTVKRLDFESLRLAIDPEPVPVGRGSQLRVDAVTKQGQGYSVLESSRLELDVGPADLAAVRGARLEGKRPGRGRIEATFDGQLSGDLAFDVASGSRVDRLIVAPEQLDLAVGEVADLSVLSPSPAAVDMTSSDPAVVEVSAANRLVGRSEGTARVEVSQAGQSRSVEVTVTRAAVRSIAIRPTRVVVPVDDTLAVRVMGQLEGDRTVELAAELISAEKTPSPRYADFDPASLEVHGESPTKPGSPESLSLRFEQHTAEAPVVVVVAPLRLELTPPGPVDLPRGQMMPLRAWANYRGGRRVGVPADRIEWRRDPPSESTPGLELRGSQVTALESGAGPLEVWGSYLGRDSNHVVFRSVDSFLPPAQPAPRDDLPAEVVIRSDQGPAVRFPVGAEFDDFRVEARYADGMTRLVTKKAALSTPDDPRDSPVGFSGGRMIGLRPGRTRVEASFDGVPAQNALDVEVAADVEVDEIRLAPPAARILPGETIALDAVGYRGGRSVGVITALGGLAWASDHDDVVGVRGPTVTGRKLGQAAVTARLGTVTSEPATVSVVDSIADALVVDQGVIRLRVGESRRVGTDVQVFRGQADLSRQVYVTPALPGVVEYLPETRSLRGVAPGVSAVTFTWGDKLATTTVEVLPAGTLEGDVVVEPGAGTLAAGQALDLRVFLITNEGFRIDRTDAAVWTSSAPGTVTVRGNRACAIGPGAAELSARLPEAEVPGKAYLTVTDDEMTELVVEPSRVRMAVGDSTRVRILGRAASGTHELFAQPALTITPGGPDPSAVEIIGSRQVHAARPGDADLTVAWEGRLSQHVPVTVTDDSLTDLAIDPAGATIHPGQMLVYQVTGTAGGRRRVLTAADGVQLSVGAASVAQVAEGTAVVGSRPGRTDVVAQVGSAEAEATLTVAPGDGLGGSVVYGPEGTRGVGPGTTYIYGPGYGYYGSGYETIYGPGGRVVYGPGGTVTTGPGYSETTPPPAVEIVPRVLNLQPTERFAKVRTTLDEGDEDFSVTAEVLAAASEGPLEYRIYPAGQTPGEGWVPSASDGEHERAVLQSPRMPYGPREARYNLVLEARGPDGSVERYPFTFRLAPNIERTDVVPRERKLRTP